MISDDAIAVLVRLDTARNSLLAAKMFAGNTDVGADLDEALEKIEHARRKCKWWLTTNKS